MILDRRRALAGLTFGLVASPVLGFPTSAQTSEAVINVLDFGAKGDGTTDDSAAVSEALRGKFRRLYFPAGSYVLSNVVLSLKDVTIDASDAELVNIGNGTPLFRVPKDARLVRSGIHVGEYRDEMQSGYFLDISGGLVSDCRIVLDKVRITSSVGGVIRHHSQQSKREFTEGLYFTNITGHRWDHVAETPGTPMIDVSSSFNSFSACNISVRDVRLLSETIFAKAVCSSLRGASFSQIKLHDISVEKCDFGFVHFEGARMCGLVNVGMFDLKDVSNPLIVFKHANFRRNTQGCYCRDIHRTSARFVDDGCDLMYDDGVLEVSNYLAIGGLVTKGT